MKNFVQIFITLMFVSMPMAFAEQTNTTNYEVYGVKEYGVSERTFDRIKLLFAFQEQRKQELVDKIELRREQHYQFLMSKGKTDQAYVFKQKTDKIGFSFEKWKVRKQETLTRLSEKNVSRNVREKLK